jgi:hypothetical protein
MRFFQLKQFLMSAIACPFTSIPSGRPNAKNKENIGETNGFV